MKRRVLVALMAACVSAVAQKETPPEGGPPKPFHLPPTQDFTLANGMQVTLVSYGDMPRVAVRAIVSAGGINEAPNQVWLSRLTGLLLKEGTQSRSAEKIANDAADTGAQLEIQPGVEDTSIGGIALSDHAADFISLVADVLRNPLLPASEAPRLKGDLARELAVAKSKPGNIARERFLTTMFPDGPYGREFPSETDLQSYTAQDAQAFYRANFSAARTHLYVAGKLDPGVRETIRRAFESWPHGAERAFIAAHPVKARSLALIDRPKAPQSTLYLGLPVADPTSSDYVPLDVMNALLGGSFASRITSNIREQKGYTYSPRSQLGTRRHVAYWVEIADVTTAVTGPSLKEIFYEVNRLRSAPPSEQELKGIQNYVAGYFVLRNTVSPDGVIGQLNFVDSQGLPRSFLSEYVQKALAVKPQDIQAMAEKYLAPEKMEIVVVGDKSQIAGQLEPYDPAAQ
jgi:zinc protease